MPAGIPVQTISAQSLQGKTVSPRNSVGQYASLSSNYPGLGHSAPTVIHHPVIERLGSKYLFIWV